MMKKEMVLLMPLKKKDQRKLEIMEEARNRLDFNARKWTQADIHIILETIEQLRTEGLLDES